MKIFLNPTTPAVLVLDTLESRSGSGGVVDLLKAWAATSGMGFVEVNPHRSSPESRLGSGDHPYKMILLRIGPLGVGDPDPQNWITSLSGRYADVPLVPVFNREQAREVVGALETAVRGFIPRSIASRTAIQVLTFVANGLAPAALTQATRVNRERLPASRKQMTVVPTASLNKVRLTARERQVLERLQLGAANKVIGRQLNLRESTVKVHIRRIMRKLGAVNRTQAALCAACLGPTTDLEKPAEAGQTGALVGPLMTVVSKQRQRQNAGDEVARVPQYLVMEGRP
jgi:DNA-binding NarL/FixJ family response regulator